MNKDNAKDFLPLVQALAEGKTIQYKKISGFWEDAKSLGFGCEPERYRIKPEPLEFDGKITESSYWPQEGRGQIVLEFYGDQLPMVVGKKTTAIVQL